MEREEDKAMLNAKILVVDDDSTFRNLLVELFTEQGYETACVMSGEEALHKLEQGCYDLATVDINLAGWITGLDLLREIKGVCPEMKVIICSAQIDKATVAEAMKLGAKEFIAKPLEDLDQLLSMVKKMLQVGVNHGHKSEK